MGLVAYMKEFTQVIMQTEKAVFWQNLSAAQYGRRKEYGNY
jgi:hypothetical protein